MTYLEEAAKEAYYSYLERLRNVEIKNVVEQWPVVPLHVKALKATRKREAEISGQRAFPL